jgi:hypothetical protein
MTQDEIIEMAKQGHASTRDAIRWAMAQEREACAKVVEDWSDWHGGTEILAKAIRARGQA